MKPLNTPISEIILMKVLSYTHAISAYDLTLLYNTCLRPLEVL